MVMEIIDLLYVVCVCACVLWICSEAQNPMIKALTIRWNPVYWIEKIQYKLF